MDIDIGLFTFPEDTVGHGQHIWGVVHPVIDGNKIGSDDTDFRKGIGKGLIFFFQDIFIFMTY
ncbi:hypothetical protein ES703_94142 [subsurface metagenome]